MFDSGGVSGRCWNAARIEGADGRQLRAKKPYIGGLPFSLFRGGGARTVSGICPTALKLSSLAHSIFSPSQVIANIERRLGEAEVQR